MAFTDDVGGGVHRQIVCASRALTMSEFAVSCSQSRVHRLSAVHATAIIAYSSQQFVQTQIVYHPVHHELHSSIDGTRVPTTLPCPSSHCCWRGLVELTAAGTCRGCVSYSFEASTPPTNCAGFLVNETCSCLFVLPDSVTTMDLARYRTAGGPSRKFPRCGRTIPARSSRMCTVTSGHRGSSTIDRECPTARNSDSVVSFVCVVTFVMATVEGTSAQEEGREGGRETGSSGRRISLCASFPA